MDKKVGIAVGLAAVVAGAVILLAKGAEPAEYPCPYCPEVFATYEELTAHVQTAHPGQRIPIDIIWR